MNKTTPPTTRTRRTWTRPIKDRKPVSELKSPKFMQTMEVKPAEIDTRYSKLKYPRTRLEDYKTGIVWTYSAEAFEDRRVPGDQPTDCWEWLGSNHRQGFGLINIGRVNDPDGRKDGHVNAQRLAYAVSVGRPLLASERVFATCHNHRCTNPDHLQIGDRRDVNMNASKRSDSKSNYVPRYFVPDNYFFISTNGEYAIARKFSITNNQAHYLRILVSRLIADGVKIVNPLEDLNNP
jgi:hypothetical protein